MDLPAFLVAPRDAAFEAFRQHYPRCPECAAEVRAWTELHEALAAAHPEPEQLARYEALPAEERALVDRHTAGCPSCREELAQLAGFDPARLAQPAAPAAVETEGGSRLRDWLAGFGRVVWSPAFAYVLVGLLLFPVVQRLAFSPDRAEPIAEQLFSQYSSTPGARAPRAVTPEVQEPLLVEREADSAAEGFAAKDEAVAKLPAAPPAQESRRPRREPAPGEGLPRAGRADGRLAALDAEKGQAGTGSMLAKRAEQSAVPVKLDAPAPAPDPKLEARVAKLAEAAETASAVRTGSAFADDLDRAAEADPREKSALAEAPALEEAAPRAAANEVVGFAALERGRAAEPAGAEPRDLLRLEAWRTARVSPPADIEALRVSVPVPDELAPGEAWLSVRDTERGRELRERVLLPPGVGRRVALPVPRAWLAPGAYRVELDAQGRDVPGLRFEVF